MKLNFVILVTNIPFDSNVLSASAVFFNLYDLTDLCFMGLQADRKISWLKANSKTSYAPGYRYIQNMEFILVCPAKNFPPCDLY